MRLSVAFYQAVCLGAVALVGCRGEEEASGVQVNAVRSRPTAQTTAVRPKEAPPTKVNGPEALAAGTPFVATWAASCLLDGPPISLSDGTAVRPRRLPSLAAGAFGDRAVVAWPLDGSHVEYVVLGGDLRDIERGNAEITGAQHLFDVRPVCGGIAITTHQVCEDRKRFEKCLYARAILGGTPAGDERVVRTREWVTGWFEVRDSPDEWWTLRSHTYIAPVVERWRVSSSRGLEVERIATLEGGEISVAAGLARSGDGFLAVTVDEGGLPRVQGSGKQPTLVKGLPPDARISAFGADGTQPIVAFTLADAGSGHPRMRVARIGADGTLVGRPSLLADGDPLPAALDRGPRGAISLDGGRLVFTRRDAAGRARSEPVTVAAGLSGHGPDAPSAAAFRATGPGGAREIYGVAYSAFEDGGFTVRLAQVRCEPAGVPSGAARAEQELGPPTTAR